VNLWPEEPDAGDLHVRICEGEGRATSLPYLDVDVSQPGTSSPVTGRPAGDNEAVEMTGAALRSLGFTAREARERAQRARENLLKEGRAALTVGNCSDLLREAFRPRWSPLPEEPGGIPYRAGLS